MTDVREVESWQECTCWPRLDSAQIYTLEWLFSDETVPSFLIDIGIQR